MAGFVVGNAAFSSVMPEKGLYIISTPIGNLGDITIRALEILSSCDVIACEDTRVTRKLLQRYAIETPMISYHEHNAAKAGPIIIGKLEEGKSVALVSDAGTPLISDPGYRLVSHARDVGYSVVPVPGASAPMAALVASGLPSNQYTFAGFLPTKQQARQTAFTEFDRDPGTVMFFESPNRLQATLQDMLKVYGPNRRACVARELTKLHEEVITQSIEGLINHFADRTIKGEVVILVEPAPQQEKTMDTDAILRDLLRDMSVSRAAAEAATLTGEPKRTLYQRALQLAAETSHSA